MNKYTALLTSRTRGSVYDSALQWQETL